ncbi:thiol reductant ABC exporter subunit CydC [Halalkalibacter akibai]|uniref:Transport ATP-binding protein CydC n=1 Tax=Halalkalibacter akibai (strain ATCC 43226 / DSM 21942 / CIP 109018 / JCM 9157 / 1139) TaxID=1236973 RepID=W4R0M0_HALA3|nr:thiol reductant ABC exporter subunit CydC [Halalkalibacter akibai]GAE37109.1 transport ATP-binding protein CydC [Halalkalibacter akibai JCM 9157]
MKKLLDIMRLTANKKKDLLLSILFGYLAGVTAVGLFAANGYLISRAALEPPLYVLITMVAVVKIGSFVRALSRYVERYYSHRATFTMLSDIRVHFYGKLEGVAPRLMANYRSGDLLARVVGDVETMQNLFLRVVYPPVVMLIVFLTTILFVSFYSAQVALIFIGGLLLTGLMIPAWFALKQRKVSSNIRKKRAYFSSEVTEWLQGFRELKIHNQLSNKEQQLLNASESYINAQQKAEKEQNKSQTVNLLFTLGISWAVLAWAGYLVATGDLDGVFLAMLVMVSLTVFELSTPMAAVPNHFEESEKAAKRLAEVVHIQKEARTDEVVENVMDEPLVIQFEKVSYTFPNEHRKTLNNITLNIPAGSKTAIVGPSGSGKSTLLQLLMNLAEPTEGEIYFNGVSSIKIDQESIRRKAKVILQDNHFFYGTVKDNLLLTSPWTDEQLKQLLNDVQLPHLNLLDLVMEKGQNLSGGEKQRLAMARAIAKEGNLWLLDEPTSALDPHTERCLYQLLESKAKNDTVVVTSHKLLGLEKMNQIIVMDQGEIIEKGTFPDLIQAKGYFYQLVEIEKSII